MKIVAVVGSPRPQGNVSYLVDQALQAASGKGIETEKIILSQYRINPCQGHDDCSSYKKCCLDDDIPQILDKVFQADGIILGSPVYYYDITAQLKIFIDRNYFCYTHDRQAKARCAGIIAIGGGAGMEYAVDSLKRYLNAVTDIPDNKIVVLTGTAGKAGEVKKNTSLLKEARQFGEKMVGMLQK